MTTIAKLMERLSPLLKNPPHPLLITTLHDSPVHTAVTEMPVFCGQARRRGKTRYISTLVETPISSVLEFHAGDFTRTNWKIVAKWSISLDTDDPGWFAKLKAWIDATKPLHDAEAQAENAKSQRACALQYACRDLEATLSERLKGKMNGWPEVWNDGEKITAVRFSIDIEGDNADDIVRKYHEIAAIASGKNTG